MAWKDKQAEATRLIAEVKDLNAAGITDADTATKAHERVAAAQTMMAEVREEKLAEENAKLAALLDDFDTKAAPQSPPSAREPIAQSSGLTATAKATTEAPTKGGRLVLSPKAMEALQLKALNEGSGAAGNFLVPPAYMQNLFAETRRQGNALRRYGLMTEHPVETNQVLIPRGSGAATVGIVAENATKPSADQAYTQLTVNIFTWAGISKVSRQLVEDSSPTAADLVARELGSLLGNLEEQKVYGGSGTGEPKGILNATGTNTTPTATQTALNGTVTAQVLIDAILDGVVGVQTNYFAEPTAVLMAPKRLAFLQKGKDTANNYLLNPPGMFRMPSAAGSGVTSVSEGTTFSPWSLFGLPIYVSANIPTNITFNSVSNTDPVIVAAWNELHWFQRQDVTLDTSGEAGTAFESNQIWFRYEERAGFTPERLASAFSVLQGGGLV